MDMNSRNISNVLQNGAPVTQQVGVYNTYVGARYVPIFDGEWSSTKQYEPLTIVSYQGNSYTSTQYVPVGTYITNTNYWAQTGNYNSQLELYIQQVNALSDSIKNLLVSQNYVTPEQYGAKGDGITNDSPAFTSAVTEAISTGKGIYLASPAYYLNDTININSSRVVIFANPFGEQTCIIKANPNLSSVFNITSPRCALYYIQIIHDIDDGSLANGIAINFNVGENYSYNCDGNVVGCMIQGYSTGIKISSKNLNVYDTLLSHCSIGIDFTIPSSASNVNYRGITIVNNRFHNIGAETNYAPGTCCIKVDQSLSNVLNQFFINGNYADLGSTFFIGQANGGWIINNYIVSLHADGIIIDNTDYTFSGISFPIICNNFLETLNYVNSKYGIHVIGGMRCVIYNNMFNGFQTSSILVENCNRCSIINNIISGASSDYEIKIINGVDCNIINNNEMYSPTHAEKSVGVLTSTGTPGACTYSAGTHYGLVNLNVARQRIYENDTSGAYADIYKCGSTVIITLGGATLQAHTNVNTDAIITLPFKIPATLELLNTLNQNRLYLDPSGVIYGTTQQNEALRGFWCTPFI